MKRLVFSLVIIFVFISEAFCGPFGIDMGMTLEQVRKISKTVPKESIAADETQFDDMYLITPPNTHNLFKSYAVKIDPTHGVYFISAVSKNISTNRYGTELLSEFNNLVNGIEKTYGKYNKQDFLLPKSIWNEPQDFMRALIDKERYLRAYWNKSEGSNMLNNIVKIEIITTAKDTSNGVLTIGYYSTHADQIIAAKKAKQDSVF
jgi:hypothetical protein